MKYFNLLIKTAVAGALITGAAMVALGRVPFGFAGNFGYHMGSGMMGHWGGGYLMPLFWVVLLAGGVLVLAKWIGFENETPIRGCNPPDAVELLRLRYARGEVDKAEYLSMMKDLSHMR